MTLWDRLVGQGHAVEELSRAAHDAAVIRAGGRGPAMTHAWLLTGPPGAGRSTAAVMFAAALQCPEAGCGDCRSCHEVLSGGHPDVVRFSPESVIIKVADARALVERAAWLPDRGRWTVVVVEDADRLNDSSGNALLKAVEEPTPHTVWLLCAPSTEDVLPTIRSRCRTLALRTPPWRDVAAMLVDGGVDPAMAAFAARAAQGHIGRARALATDEEARLRRQEVLRVPTSLDDLPACFSAAADIVAAATEDATAYTDPLDAREREELLAGFGIGATGTGMSRARIERMAASRLKELEAEQKRRRTRSVRDRLDRALVDLLSFYRDVLALQLDTVAELVNEELRPTLAAVAADSTAVQTRRRLDAIGRARAAFESNAAPQLVLEALTVELARP